LTPSDPFPLEREFKAFRDALGQLDPEMEGTLAVLFVSGCCLSLQGHAYEGRTACRLAMRAVRLQELDPLAYAKIIRNIQGNETDFSERLPAQTELKALARSLA